MPLASDYIGSVLAWPLKFVKPSRGAVGYPKDNRVELTCVPSQIVRQSWTDPIASDNDGISASHAGASSAGTTNMTIGGALASGGVATLTHARNVVIVVTHGSAVVAMSGTIAGTRHGRVLTEAWSVSAGGTTKTFTGNKAFDTVTSITETIAATAAANTIIAGTGEKLGLDFKNSSVTFITEEVDGANPTAGTLVAASTVSTADPRGTYTPNSATNGARDYVVRFASDDLADIY